MRKFFLLLFSTAELIALAITQHSFEISGIYTFTAAYGVSIGPIAWILPSEVFPLSMRSKGVALSTASNWLNNCMCFHWAMFTLSFFCLLFSILYSPHWALDSSYVQFFRVVSTFSKSSCFKIIKSEFIIRATFITFATACGFAYLWATYIVPETANVSLEEIDTLFESAVLKEEIAVKRQVNKIKLVFLSFDVSLT